MDAAGLRTAAAAVLVANDAGGWTRPSAAQYPHQWNWDSAFISYGWSVLDWGRAAREIESLLEGQWGDGMIPHVRYDAALRDAYFPGPDRWPGAQGRARRAGVLTSGISNPPVAVSAALAVGLRQPDRARRHEFWGRVLAPLRDWLRWFLVHRRAGDCPLPVTVHPWETGWDNSPRWDHLAAAGLRPERAFARADRANVPAAQRPGDRDYDAYLALVEMLDAAGYRLDRYLERSPFAVYDVLLDALWYQAAVDLNRMAAEVDAPPAFDAAELADYAAAFEAVHWDEGQGTYLDHDLVRGRRIAVATPAALAGLGAGLARPERALSIWEAFRAAGGPLHPVWTVAPAEAAFDPLRYWRGPVWAHINWLLARGLEHQGLAGPAAEMAAATLAMVDESGFAEYFNPFDRSPLGAGSFSWTAALTLDLLR